MDLYKRITNDRNVFLKNRDKDALASCKLILGEITRDPKKDYSTENVLKIIKGLRKMTLKSPIKDSLLVDMIDKYLPELVSDIDVVSWVKSQYTFEDICAMGKKAYSIIGKAKQHFKDREFNSVYVKSFIDDVLDDNIHKGIEAYFLGDKLEVQEIESNPELFDELLDDLTNKKKLVSDDETTF